MKKVNKKVMEEIELLKGVAEMCGFDTMSTFRELSEDKDYYNLYCYIYDLPINTRKEIEFKLIKHVLKNAPQFEEEKPKKYVVQSKETDRNGYYWTLCETDFGVYNFGVFLDTYKFDTREEAEKWTNPQMEVVEVEE